MKPMEEQHFAILRRHMVEVIAIHADLMSDELGHVGLDRRVLAAMERVPRHHFIPLELAAVAYHDGPLPIGFDKTISQPFICALMTHLLAPEPDQVVLEVGTGLGYQAAVLAELVAQVWSVEIVEELAGEAQSRLRRLGTSRVGIRIGDGSRGWAEHAPYDRIMVTAAGRPPADGAPGPAAAGRPSLVMPLGPDQAQILTVIDKDAGGTLHAREILPVRFSRLETVL